MKYVKTKEGIYPLIYKDTHAGWAHWTVWDNAGIVKDEDDLYKHLCERGWEFSEDIEDLCDDFVLFIGDQLYVCLYDKDFKEFIVNHDGDCKTFKKEDCDIVYGTIRTNKGLLYVAKMNENGEWELI